MADFLKLVDSPAGSRLILQGNSAFALGVVHAGYHAADGYPGTPSTEVIDKNETLLSAFDKDIANQKKRVGKDRVASTLWAMERSRKDVAEFIQSHYRRTDMSMLELTPEFIKDFSAYLRPGLAGIHLGLFDRLGVQQRELPAARLFEFQHV